MGHPAMEFVGCWVELGLSTEMEIPGKSLTDWYYVGPGGLWWSNVLNSALPPEAQAWHQARAQWPCQPHGWIHIRRARNRKGFLRAKSLTVGLLAGSLQHLIPYIISWWQIQSIALLWLASWVAIVCPAIAATLNQKPSSVLRITWLFIFSISF